MIYVVIPVHNRKDLTQTCLASLQQQDTANFAVIVVDDGSTDGTSEMIREEFPDTILLHGDGTLWWVGAINKGIRYALSVCESDDCILSLNDDLIVPVNYISGLANAAQSHPEAIIGSVETTIKQPNIIKSGGIHVNWKTGKRTVLNQGRRIDEFPPGHMIPVSKLTGRGTLFPCKVLREVGIYDEVHFKQCGDTELPSRAHFKFGYPLFVSYDAVVISHVGNGEGINEREYYTISDIGEYFLGIRSHFNLKDHYWFARKVAPNFFWFLRYFPLDLVRIIGRFLIRLKLRKIPRS
jgi:GT2 family glycosyltransferase